MVEREAFDRGDVIWHPGLFKTSGRPWLVLSTDNHPFHGEEYLVVGITTTPRPAAIELSTTAWELGGLPKDSYVSPWFVTTIKHSDIEQGIGRVSADACTTILQDVRDYFKQESTPSR